MEQEKDNRHYAILEASSRLSSGQPDARWMEGMKFGLSNLSANEYSAGRQMGRMARTVAPMELRQGVHDAGARRDAPHPARNEYLCATTCEVGEIQQATISHYMPRVAASARNFPRDVRRLHDL